MKMFSFSGVAISKDGLVYIADGGNIRTVDEAGIIRTIIGSQESPRHWVPLPCFQAVDAAEVSSWHLFIVLPLGYANRAVEIHVNLLYVVTFKFTRVSLIKYNLYYCRKRQKQPYSLAGIPQSSFYNLLKTFLFARAWAGSASE